MFFEMMDVIESDIKDSKLFEITSKAPEVEDPSELDRPMKPIPRDNRGLTEDEYEGANREQKENFDNDRHRMIIENGAIHSDAGVPMEAIQHEAGEPALNTRQAMIDAGAKNMESDSTRRDLTEGERKEIQEKTGWTDKQMDKCTMNEDGTVHYKTDNEHLEGQVHEPSGVKYVKKVVDINGVKVEVVVPAFDSVLDVQLPENLEKTSNDKQFKVCNQALKEKVESDPAFKKQFTEDQLEDIMDGEVPEGYTWHHDAETGKMQLVETAKHDRTQGGAAHTGGKALWGGSY